MSSDSLTFRRRSPFLHRYWILTSDLPRELRDPALLVATDHVLDRHPQSSLFALDLRGLHLDQLPQPLLQGSLHQELGGRGQLVAVGREDKLHQPAAEVRAVNAFAGRGEQHLLDQVTDVVLLIRVGSPAPDVQVEWVVDLHQVPLALTWVATTLGGPCGICSALWHRPVLVWSMAG